MQYSTMNSPLGAILIARNDEGITAIQFDSERRPPPPAEWEHDASALSAVVQQLGEYFAGRRTRFDLPLAPSGTAFQRTVWDALVEIPFGETRSYGEIAKRIGAPSASRAVGAANGRNPIAIVIPCHRVIGASGSLTGYAGGLAIKRALLELEWTVGSQPQPQNLVGDARMGSGLETGRYETTRHLANIQFRGLPPPMPHLWLPLLK